jgi:hypothetical protein
MEGLVMSIKTAPALVGPFVATLQLAVALDGLSVQSWTVGWLTPLVVLTKWTCTSPTLVVGKPGPVTKGHVASTVLPKI